MSFISGSLTLYNTKDCKCFSLIAAGKTLNIDKQNMFLLQCADLNKWDLSLMEYIVTEHFSHCLYFPDFFECGFFWFQKQSTGEEACSCPLLGDGAFLFVCFIETGKHGVGFEKSEWNHMTSIYVKYITLTYLQPSDVLLLCHPANICWFLKAHLDQVTQVKTLRELWTLLQVQPLLLFPDYLWYR